MLLQSLNLMFLSQEVRACFILFSPDLVHLNIIMVLLIIMLAVLTSLLSLSSLPSLYLSLDY